jgi:stage V sporulation protein AC
MDKKIAMLKQCNQIIEGDGIFMAPKKQLTLVQQHYQQFVKEREPQRPVFLNVIRAFVAGGLICVLGQVVQQSLVRYLAVDAGTAGKSTGAILIVTAILLTGLGVYDRLAQWAGAGSAVPVTGFANSMMAAAMEHRSEGFVLGVGAKMFEVAGAVIVYGVFAAFVVAVVKLSLRAWGGG